jgi:flagella basal body P-ring formation protein FlgA
VILNRSLPKGAIVTDADLTMAQIAGLSPDQTFRSINDVAGRRLKSALGAGKPVLQRHVEPLWLVEIGAPVVLIASAGGLEVSAPAEAIEPGGMGDLVRVLNLASGREVKAVVTGPNRVTAQTNIR